MSRSKSAPSGGAARRAGTTRGRILMTAVLAGGLWLSASAGKADERSRADYIEGYATAVLERAESQDGFSLALHGDLLRVDFAVEPDVPFDTILRALLEIEGITQAEILVDGELFARSTRQDEDPGAAGAIAASGGAGPSASGGASARDARGPSGASGTAEDADDGWDIFPRGELFAPLLADPRWPHFSASYLSYLGDEDLDQVGSATFGETFSLVRSPRHAWGQVEFGFQAGVFSVFDLEASSSDLVNADYLVGLTATHAFGDIRSMLRVYHQSSHLGDEFLLRTRVNRVNLSFEVVDLLVAYQPRQWLRLYAGGGVLVHREPALDRGIVELGMELESPRAFVDGYLRPVAGSDFQFREESDWKEDVSVRAGIQVEHPSLRRARLKILAEFYTGRSPNGQFYDERINTIGVGIHLDI